MFWFGFIVGLLVGSVVGWLLHVWRAHNAAVIAAMSQGMSALGRKAAEAARDVKEADGPK